MGEVLKASETRTRWVVCDAHEGGKWVEHGFWQETEEEGYRKLRWLRRWHPQAFLVSMVMTPCDGEATKTPMNWDPESPGAQPAGRPQLRLV
jgi:hypothetical protein